MNLNAAQWKKILGRWSELAESPERNLLLAVIAQAIEDEQRRAYESGGIPKYNRGFFVRGLRVYCNVVGIGYEFLIEQLHRSAEFARVE